MHKYHTCHKNKALATVDDEEELSDGEEELSDEEDDVSTISVFRFKASPGWLNNFMQRKNVAFLKLKGEKGSADEEVVDQWVHDWMTSFCDVYMTDFPMPFRQAVHIVVNFMNLVSNTNPCHSIL